MSSSLMAGAKKTWEWNKHSADIAVNEHDMTGGYYDEILTQLRARLASDHIRSHRHNRPILATVGTTTDENRWFDIRMHVKIEKNTRMHVDTVELRLRREDIYVQGYRVNGQTWREFKPDKDKDGKESIRIDKHSQLLSYHGSYGALRNYATLGAVGGATLIQAAKDLATRNYADPEVAKALFVIIVMFCEAARFVPVNLFVQRDFLHSSSVPGWVDALVIRWGKLCGHVLYFHHKEKWANLTLRIDVHGHVKDVLVTSLDDMLEYLAILQKNPAKIHPYSEN